MRPSQLLAAAVAFSSVTAASSSLLDDINAMGEAKHMFLPRQDNTQSSSDAKPSDAPKSDQSSASNAPTSSGGDSKATSAKNSKSDQATKTTGKPKVTNFGPDVQPGAISMVTPDPILGPQYYKVGDWVTLAWNYSRLSVTPAAVDILASCSVNQQTYTIAVNQSAQQTSILWDTGSYRAAHPNGPDFVSEMYTLLIYDSQSSVSAVPKPGYLSPFSQFYFGLYQRQEYKPWKDWECPNCLKNDALSLLASPTLRVLLATFGTTIASFLYFASAFGVW